MEGDARRLSYQALGKGVPVRAAGGEETGITDRYVTLNLRAHWKRDD